MQAQLPWIRRRLRSLFRGAPPDLDELEQKVLLNVLRSLPSYRGERLTFTSRLGRQHHALRVRS